MGWGKKGEGGREEGRKEGRKEKRKEGRKEGRKERRKKKMALWLPQTLVLTAFCVAFGELYVFLVIKDITYLWSSFMGFAYILHILCV